MRALPRAAVPFLPAAVVLVLLLWWAEHDGGYAPRDWLPGGLLVGALLAVTVFALGPMLRMPSRPVLVALGAFAAYTAWSFLSVTWAEDPGRALQGSERTLVYLAVLALFALLPWTPRSAVFALGAWIAGVTLLGVVALAGTITGDPTSSFEGARFSDPLTYYNADAALWTMGALPALVLAARRELPAALRPALLGAATFLLGLSFITQSRGWALGLVLTLGVALLVLPGRLRLLVAFAVAGVALAPAAPTLLDPYNLTAGLPEGQTAAVLAQAMDDAARMLGVAVVLALALGFGLTALDVRFPPTPRGDALARTGGRALALVTFVALLGAVVVVTDADPVGWSQDRWDEFKGGEQTATGGAGRFASFGSTRYDLYRVSVDVFRDHPLRGTGQDNFLNEYLLLRGNDYEEARWTHSLPLRLLVHTGLIGALLFVVAMAAALVAVWRTRGPSRVAAGAALLVVAMWAGQGLIDWLWEYPVLTVATFALLGIAVALGDAPAARPLGAPVRWAAVATGVVTVLLTAPAWIADRDIAQASVQWPSDPANAFKRLDRAHALDPLNVRPPTVEAIIAARRGDLDRAVDAFTRAADRDPHNWFPRYQLALLAAQRDQDAIAALHLYQAMDRNPREPQLREALASLRSGNALTFQQVDERLRRNR